MVLTYCKWACPVFVFFFPKRPNKLPVNFRLKDVAERLMKYSIYAKNEMFLIIFLVGETIPLSQKFHILSMIQNFKYDFHIGLPMQVKGAKCFLEVASSVWIYFWIGSVQHLVELHLCWKTTISDRVWGRDSCKLQFFCYFRDFPRSEEISWENENCCNEVWPEPPTIYVFFLTGNHTKGATSAFWITISACHRVIYQSRRHQCFWDAVL